MTKKEWELMARVGELEEMVRYMTSLLDKTLDQAETERAELVEARRVMAMCRETLFKAMLRDAAPMTEA